MLFDKPVVVGDSLDFNLLFQDRLTRVPNNITGYTIKVRIWRGANQIVKTTPSQIVILDQTGENKGKALVQINEVDWPAAWVALTPGEKLTVRIEVERINASSRKLTPVKDEFEIEGQAIV